MFCLAGEQPPQFTSSRICTCTQRSSAAQVDREEMVNDSRREAAQNKILGLWFNDSSYKNKICNLQVLPFNVVMLKDEISRELHLLESYN